MDTNNQALISHVADFVKLLYSVPVTVDVFPAGEDSVEQLTTDTPIRKVDGDIYAFNCTVYGAASGVKETLEISIKTLKHTFDYNDLEQQLESLGFTKIWRENAQDCTWYSKACFKVVLTLGRWTLFENTSVVCYRKLSQPIAFTPRINFILEKVDEGYLLSDISIKPETREPFYSLTKNGESKIEVYPARFEILDTHTIQYFPA